MKNGRNVDMTKKKIQPCQAVSDPALETEYTQVNNAV